ncbi:MAG: TerC family protein [Planctomycetales bacterium]
MTEALIALVALTTMEIVLGIDNVVFIAVLSGRLPPHQQAQARRLGLGLAMVMRIALLLALTWIMSLEAPLFTLDGLGITGLLSRMEPDALEQVNEVSVRDLILLGGGLFLIAKSVHEIHVKLEGADHAEAKEAASLGGVLAQVIVLDVVFSLDSVITAVGMAKDLWVMITAIVLAVVVMLVFAGAVGRFVEKHPTVKMLALSFLILIGVMLVAEGIGTHINKGYIYFAMAFALIVEFLNMKVRTRRIAHAPGDMADRVSPDAS